jgi:hypothetical protein
MVTGWSLHPDCISPEPTPDEETFAKVLGNWHALWYALEAATTSTLILPLFSDKGI